MRSSTHVGAGNLSRNYKFKIFILERRYTIIGCMDSDVPPVIPPEPPVQPPPLPPAPAPAEWGEPTLWARIKKFFGPFAVVGVLIAKFFAKLKFLLLPALKFLPVLLKTGGSMILMIWIYAITYGFWFALGFVLLIFVHETGHLIAAKRLGLKVGAPVFIPFMGALIALKDAPPNAWVEAQVGIGGPLLGTIGAACCEGIYQLTGNLLFRALAHSGFLINLFNLMPIGFLDGGRIVTALSPWLWILGFIGMGILTFFHPNFLVILILIVSLPRLFSLFRAKTEEERRYYEVTPAQRLIMTVMYFGLIAFLVLGMVATFIPRESLP
jgi:Zn-dependent protease